MIKAFIFDMDGVIIDSEPMHFETEKMVMREFGIEIQDDELSSYVGVAGLKMWADLIDKYQLNAAPDMLVKKKSQYSKIYFGNESFSTINGIDDLLGDLKRKGIYIGLASSSAREFIELILNKLNIFHYFDVIVSGEEVGKSKPEPEIFLKAASHLNVSPQYCMVLEDSSNGVKAAKSAGMKCIAFRNPNSGNQDLSLADIVVDSISDINYSAV
jgi:beta-phosphoglucomutase family hydrolase